MFRKENKKGSSIAFYALIITIINLLLLKLYLVFIYPANRYIGFYPNLNLGLGNFISIIFHSFITALLIPKVVKSGFDVFVTLLVIFIAIPSFLFALSNQIDVVTYLSCSSSIFISILIIKLIGSIKFSVRKVKLNLINIDKYFISILCIMVSYFIYSKGIEINFNLDEVYKRRLAVRSEDSAFFSYLIAAVGSSISLYALYLGFLKKSLTLLLLPCFLGIMRFFYDGTKNSIVYPVLLFLVLLFDKYVFHSRRASYAKIILISVGFLLSFSLIELSIFDYSYVADYVVRRVMVIPGLVHLAYFDFSFNLYSGFAGYLFGNYDLIGENLRLTYLIGEKYLYGQDTNANSSFIAHGFFFGGLIGVLFVSIIMGIIWALINSISKKETYNFLLIIGVYYGLIFVEQSLHTAMLTNGFFLTFLIYGMVNMRSFTYLKKQ